MQHDKTRDWSEGRGTTDDVMHGLGGDLTEDVSELATKRGIILMTDCPSCGRQYKGIVTWAEVSQWELKRTAIFRGDQRQAVQFNPNEERPTRQGLLITVRCNGGDQCRRGFPCMISWDELRSWVHLGVQTGALTPQILQLSQGGGSGRR